MQVLPRAKYIVKQLSPVAIKSEAEEIVGELCAFAPNTEIHDCIRLYAIDKSVPLIKAALMRKTKPTIISSLDYLGLSLEWNDFKKPDLVMVLLSRIRNLLPEECSVCNEIVWLKINLWSCLVKSVGRIFTRPASIKFFELERKMYSHQLK